MSGIRQKWNFCEEHFPNKNIYLLFIYNCLHHKRTITWHNW